jgi:hypothetical protein
MLGNCLVAAQLVASRVVLSSTELANYLYFMRLCFLYLYKAYVNVRVVSYEL